MYSSPHYQAFLSDLKKDKKLPSPSKSESLFEDSHKYELSLYEAQEVFVREIYQDVINSSAFQRLKKIHFLGAIDYVLNPEGPKPNKRHTRYQHSLGVARLALQFAREKQLDDKQEILCVVSALLHDIGHAPLSHSLESVFKQEYGIGHHLASERIIKGEVAIGRDLHRTLTKYVINPFEILEIINGTGPPPYREIFSYAINIDTIEAILRASTYIYQRIWFWSPSQVLTALIRRDPESVPVLDGFWRLKDEVYSKLINHRMGIVADHLCQEYMRNKMSTFFEEYYYLSEEQLKEEHLELFQSLQRLATTDPAQLLPYTREIKYRTRQFVINKQVPLESIRTINDRYIQTHGEEVYRLTE